MKPLRWLAAFTAATGWALLSTPASIANSSTQTLYDYTLSISPGGFGGPNEMGQILQLAQPSFLTRLTFSASSGPVFGFTTDIGVRLYKANGLAELPGDLIWAGVVEDVALTRDITLTSIDIPHIYVAGPFAVAIDQLFPDDRYSITFHATALNPEHFGQYGNVVVRRPTDWFLSHDWYSLAIKLEGLPVPEPTSSLLVTLGLLTVSVRRRLSAKNIPYALA